MTILHFKFTRCLSFWHIMTGIRPFVWKWHNTIIAPTVQRLTICLDITIVAHIQAHYHTDCDMPRCAYHWIVNIHTVQSLWVLGISLKVLGYSGINQNEGEVEEKERAPRFLWKLPPLFCCHHISELPHLIWSLTKGWIQAFRSKL